MDFKNSCLLITGGTGSFGQAVLSSFLRTSVQEIRIFSRDEEKQGEMRTRISDDKVKFYLGDVRDKEAILAATKGVDLIFHAAALKQVPSCEFYPMEAIKTNVLGTANVLDAAIINNVKKVVCLSTDKAVYPVNAMGMSKALMEKMMVAKSREINSSGPVFCATRYGNVMASRGSVIPLFANQISRGTPLTITNPNMTRFMMSLPEAVELVFYALQHASNGDIFVQKAPAATIDVLAKSMCSIFGVSDHPIDIVGTRHGEKLFETLMSSEEMSQADDLEKYYRIKSDKRNLNYSKFVDGSQCNIEKFDDYNSHNTMQLDKKMMKKMLSGLDYFKDRLST